MMKRYIKMPQKSAFSLLVVCVILLSLLLSCTAGCTKVTTDRRVDTITEDYNGYTITRKVQTATLHPEFGSNKLIIEGDKLTANVNGNSIEIMKTYDDDGNLRRMSQTVNGKTTTADFTGKGDPLPGNKAIERVIDNLTATPTPTVTPTTEVLPITPFDSDHVDIAVATPVPHSDDHVDTPEHIEGGV